jgi:hypothetical protein
VKPPNFIHPLRRDYLNTSVGTSVLHTTEPLMMPSPRSCDTATENISNMAQLGFPWLVLAWLERDITLNAMAWHGRGAMESNPLVAVICDLRLRWPCYSKLNALL